MDTNFMEILRILPRHISSEIGRVAQTRRGGVFAVSEIRLICGGGSSMLLGGNRIRLFCIISESDMEKTLMALCKNALYAHRDTITEGYICYPGGIRVGVCGQARYEGDKLVGVSEVGALVFRFPTAPSDFADELYAAYTSAEKGMLIYSVAGVGKTTALRTLASGIAKNESTSIAVVDERCEFFVEECRALGIALLRGYKRSLGMEIALRTLRAELVMIDEIGGKEEALSIKNYLQSGIKFVATAHAPSLAEVKMRDGVAPLVEIGAFDVFFGIFHTDAGYSFEVSKCG